MLKKILIITLAIFIAIQFFRPVKNVNAGSPTNAIERHYVVPADVLTILKRSCYDCHSNNTYYPWYNTIQPVAWLLAHDVKDGKRHLNFDEFYVYKTERQKHKLEEVTEQIKEDEMPMGIYTAIHRDAVLSDGQKQRLITWADSLRNAIR